MVVAELVFVLSLALVGPISVESASYDPLNINAPDIEVKTELNGYVGLTSGDDGDVLVRPGQNGTVMLDADDLLDIIKMISSKPPVWQTINHPVSSKTPYGHLGVYRAGQTIDVIIAAMDPEGTSITYTRVAGDTPPGLTLNSKTGHITGITPNVDATYTFTVRATDEHGKYADNKFRIALKGYEECTAKSCQNEGVCVDNQGMPRCDCVRPHGGMTCDLQCINNPLGIQTPLKYVTDAQMTGYNMRSSSLGSDGRLQASSAWFGMDATSYLQIDFGNSTDIYRVDTEYYTSYYYTSHFYIQYSQNGNEFFNYTDYTGATQNMLGASTSGPRSYYLPTVLSARYVRMFPLSWNTSYNPAFRVEMYGCYSYTMLK